MGAARILVAHLDDRVVFAGQAQTGSPRIGYRRAECGPGQGHRWRRALGVRRFGGSAQGALDTGEAVDQVAVAVIGPPQSGQRGEQVGGQQPGADDRMQVPQQRTPAQAQVRLEPGRYGPRTTGPAQIDAAGEHDDQQHGAGADELLADGTGGQPSMQVLGHRQCPGATLRTENFAAVGIQCHGNAAIAPAREAHAHGPLVTGPAQAAGVQLGCSRLRACDPGVCRQCRPTLGGCLVARIEPGEPFGFEADHRPGHADDRENHPRHQARRPVHAEQDSTGDQAGLCGADGIGWHGGLLCESALKPKYE